MHSDSSMPSSRRRCGAFRGRTSSSSPPVPGPVYSPMERKDSKEAVAEQNQSIGEEEGGHPAGVPRPFAARGGSLLQPPRPADTSLSSPARVSRAGSEILEAQGEIIIGGLSTTYIICTYIYIYSYTKILLKQITIQII
jgi:hypothetical protein